MNHDQILTAIADNIEEFIAIRHRIHQHPEMAFEEQQTSDLVASLLSTYGYEVHRGLGKTGVVGVLKRGNGSGRLGLRADMDALPIEELTALPYQSQHPGVMHACGHDGHTATLLAAARYLARHGNFDGTLQLVFQPAEEGLGGARHMVEDGLFEQFPCDAIFAFHNMPGYPTGKIGILPGAFMSSSDTVNVRIRGQGGHGSMPHTTVDAVVVSAYIITALQSIVSRQIDPRQMAVITVGAMHAGKAPNVIADSAEFCLSVRAYDPAIRLALKEKIISLINAQAAVFGAQAEIDYVWRYPALNNNPDMTDLVRQTVQDWCGQNGLIEKMEPLTGSEDFAFMLERCPGAYFIIGNGDGPQGSCMVHNPHYNFNDAILPVGATFWVKLTETFLQTSSGIQA